MQFLHHHHSGVDQQRRIIDRVRALARVTRSSSSHPYQRIFRMDKARWPVSPPAIALLVFLLFLAGCPDFGTEPVVIVPADLDPAWSPDGARIAFTHEQGDEDDEPSGLYLMKADGTGRQLLVPGARMPTWSPDGQFLVYRGGFSEVYRLDFEALESNAVLFGGDHIHMYPAWSPDEKRVAFGSSISTPKLCCHLHLMNPDGTEIRRIHFENDDSIGATRPTWSPDGRQLAFQGFPRSGREIMVVDTTGENLRRLTRGRLPAWCPVCNWIVFVVHEQGGGGSLRVIRPDGTEERTLLRGGSRLGGFAQTVPSWSPDGEWIIFGRYTGGRTRFWLVRPDGTGLRMLSE